MSFENLGLDPRLLKGVAAMGYTQPTPIQQQSIPLALAGHDIVGCAQTGTGKTAAFILPILQRLGQGKGIRALVVTPTRELAVQIEEVAQYFGRYTGHRAMAVFGGVGYPGQVKRLRQGVHLLVATPGRLLDMQRRGDIELGGVSTLVLDEADRMLDMGFWPDVRRIVNSLPTERQTWLFSATMSDQVLSVIGSALKDPQKVEIGRSATPAEAIDQALYPVGAGQKSDLLIEMIQRQNLDRILVFTRTKHRADRLCRILGRAGVRSSAIHSNRSQLQRQKALDQFKNGKCSVLVATDIVARGIDVDNISHVINFDLPGNPEDYVHRIGRTARAGTSGTAISFFTGEETAELRAIEGLIKTTLRSEDLEGFIYSSDRTVPNPNREAKKVRRLAYNGGALSGKRRRRPQRSRAMAR